MTEAGTFFSYLFQGGVFPETPEDVRKGYFFSVYSGNKKKQKELFSD